MTDTEPTPTATDLARDAELIEQLAAIEHERWSDWQRWCHKILREQCPSPELERVLERWDRQISTPYADLSEQEKESDREQVYRYWPLVQLRFGRASNVSETIAGPGQLSLSRPALDQCLQAITMAQAVLDQLTGPDGDRTIRRHIDAAEAELRAALSGTDDQPAERATEGEA